MSLGLLLPVLIVLRSGFLMDNLNYPNATNVNNGYDHNNSFVHIFLTEVALSCLSQR